MEALLGLKTWIIEAEPQDKTLARNNWQMYLLVTGHPQESKQGK
jgi:hypothetical protein